jgi:hypothetical protein
LSKASDLVNHNILLQKLYAYGITGTARNWFVSYLKKRKQLVEIDYFDTTTNKITHKLSEERLIQYGVPQGFILGLLLFLIYINDVDTNISNKMCVKLILFADYTSIPTTGKNINK